MNMVPSKSPFHRWTACSVVSALFFVDGARAEPWKQYADATQAGFSADRIEEARKFADSIGSTAVVVAYRGIILAAWGEVERPLEIHSVRKSLFSGLFGIHVAAGTIDLQKNLEQLGIDDDPPLTAAEKQAKVVDLLRSRSGVYHTAAKEPSDMKASRPPRGSHAPGEHFWYNNWDFNTLGPILERATEKKVADEFYARIVAPLGMEDFRPQDASEQLEPSNSIHAAYAFRISARDLARFGQLFVQKGGWAARQIITESWIKESTTKQTAFADGDGYGYMWWVHPKGTFKADAGYTALNAADKFSARGTGGQFLLVIPDAEFVFAHTVDTENNRRVPGPKIWKLAEMVLSAKVSELPANPSLTALSPLRFSNPPPPPPKERSTITLNSRQLQAYPGEYAIEPQMHVRVFEYNERLFANVRSVGEAELFAESETAFFTKSGNAVVVFIRDSLGNLTGAKVEFAGQVLTLPKTK